MTSKSETAMETDPISKPQSQANSGTETSFSHSKSQTLPDSTSNATQPSFSKLLQGVMAANSAASPDPLVKEVRIQADFGRSHQQALADVTAKAEEAQKQQDQTKTSAIIHEEKQSLQYKDHVQEAKERVDKLDGKERDSGHIKERANDTPWAANSDGYSWRKYGQKQVKNSGSSRSYYRCTYLNCYAKKKVQHLDASGRIIAVVYKGEHNHDPPQHLKVSNRKRDGNSAQKLDDRHIMTSTYRKEVEQAVESQNTQCRESNPNSSSSISQRDAGEEHIKIPDPTQRLKNEVATLPIEAEHRKSSKSDEVGRTDPKKNCDVIPLKKRRIKEFSKACSESVYRTFKEPKVVVHTAGDGESSSDGYRWRKYGQKMVKGNPNPRSYYRCSSAGCPVRKHVERATDNSTAMIVTYEGTHDHEKPVLKKCHSSLKSPPHVTTPTTPGQKSEPKSPTRTQAQSLPKSRDVDSDNEGDKPAEVGSDKVLESARTLLSIGIELKSC